MKVDVEMRNFKALEDGRFDCEILHPSYGWVAFTADPNDPEAHGRAIWSEIKRRFIASGTIRTYGIV